LLILIHGGGWKGLNRKALEATVATAVIFRSLGIETMTVDYRRGAQGVADVERFYQDARKRFGPNLPVCALGASAGGHIALMLAIRFPTLACAIDMAGPTDLATLGSQGSPIGYQIAKQAFGVSAFIRFSPALHDGTIKAKVMLVYADNDPLVPVAQGEEMARADPRAELIKLPPGRATFVHTGVGAPIARSGVSATAKRQAQLAEVRFLLASMNA
jgi:acetyl esterase/lipase